MVAFLIFVAVALGWYVYLVASFFRERKFVPATLILVVPPMLLFAYGNIVTEKLDLTRESLEGLREKTQRAISELAEANHVQELKLVEAQVGQDTNGMQAAAEALFKGRYMEAYYSSELLNIEKLSKLWKDVRFCDFATVSRLESLKLKTSEIAEAIKAPQPVSEEETFDGVLRILSRYRDWDQRFGGLIDRYSRVLVESPQDPKDLARWSAQLRVISEKCARLSGELTPLLTLCDTQPQRDLVNEFDLLLHSTSELFATATDTAVKAGRDYSKKAMLARLVGRVARSFAGRAAAAAQLGDTADEAEDVTRLGFILQAKIADVSVRTENFQKDLQRFNRRPASQLRQQEVRP